YSNSSRKSTLLSLSGNGEMGDETMTNLKTFTEAELLAYFEKNEDRKYKDEKEASKAMDKMVTLLERFGYVYNRSFLNFNPSQISTYKPATTWYYRKMTSEFGYIEIQIGWTNPKNPKGVFRVYNNTNVEINPDTKKPYEVGDTKMMNGGRIGVLRT